LIDQAWKPNESSDIVLASPTHEHNVVKITLMISTQISSSILARQVSRRARSYCGRLWRRPPPFSSSSGGLCITSPAFSAEKSSTVCGCTASWPPPSLLCLCRRALD
jgi:hypothetical protein